MKVWRVEADHVGTDIGKSHITSESSGYFATKSKRAAAKIAAYIILSAWEYDGTLPWNFKVLEIEAERWRPPRPEEKSGYNKLLDEDEIIVEKGKIVREYKLEDLKKLFTREELGELVWTLVL